MLRRVAIGVGALLALVLAWLLLWPVPVRPVFWSPPPAPPLVFPWEAGSGFDEVEVFSAGEHEGPEDVQAEPDGTVYVGTRDGAVLRWDAEGKGPEVFAETGGRPLGLHRALDGRLLVADGVRGLLAIDGEGQVEVLMDEVDGTPVRFADDLDVAEDGTVYVSEASTKFDVRDWPLDILESRPNGRLLSFDPASGEASVVGDDLFFANGVAVAHDGRSVLVVETSRYRVSRVWLDGPTAGSTATVIDNLPGFPDGISRAAVDGVYWVSVASPRNELVDATAGLPWVRKMIVRLPAFLRPAPERFAMVFAVDEDGEILEVVLDPAGERFSTITTVTQVEDHLYLGSLTASAWARLPSPLEPPPPPPEPSPDGRPAGMPEGWDWTRGQ